MSFMKILNIMLGKGLGGLEQVFLNYTEALHKHGHRVISVIHPGSALRDKVAGPYHTLFNFNKYDPLAIYRLKKFCQKEDPDLIITHGNRATTLFRKTKSKKPHIAVCHNYQTGPLIGSHALITITEDIKTHVVKAGQRPETVHVVPNMIQLTPHFKESDNALHTPPVIGFLGRFEPKKGAHLLLESLALLKEEGIVFKALLGGDGPQKEELLKMVSSFELINEIQFEGWVEDKEKFFNQIDLLAVPSFKEAFGLVILEAFSYGTPIASTATPGPSSIGTDAQDILLSPLGDTAALALNLKRLIQDSEMRARIRAGGFKTLERYTPEIVAQKLNEVIHAVI